MKKITFLLLTLLMITGLISMAQERSYPEKFGNTLNLGLGLGYYGYVENPLPVVHADFEFDVVRNFTLAPFINFYTYRNKYYHNQNHYYFYETVIPIGVKATYYFDELLKANPHWDFYLAGSLGFAIRNSHWDDGYDGDEDHFHGANPLYIDLHIGSEYHFNNKLGAYLDLSTGVSTIGLAIHF
ncbi:MAG: hypothetical protein WC341_15440 [Bacteroidales bacterium]|jgi:hypothetical protein